jgi:hypothetical protein
MPNAAIEARRADIARRVAACLIENADLYHDGFLTHDDFGRCNLALWKKAEAFKSTTLVSDHLRADAERRATR